MSNSTKSDDDKFIESAGMKIPKRESKEDLAASDGTTDLLSFTVVVSYAVSVTFILMSMYKLFFYDSQSYSTINAYVGGDAYNYIINGAVGTAYAVLALVFALFGSVAVIVRKMNGERRL